MNDLQFHIDDSPPIIQRALAAVLPIVFGGLFIYIGVTKFRSTGMWVSIFQRIGLGQWFRYLTGVMQAGGGLLVLLPRTRMVGAALIACTMLGAAFADLFVLNFGPAAIVPLVLLAVSVAVGWSVWLNRD